MSMSTVRADADWLAASRVTFGEARHLLGGLLRLFGRVVCRVLVAAVRITGLVLWCLWYLPGLLRALVIWRHAMARAGLGQVKVMPRGEWEPYAREKPRRAPRRWGAMVTPTGYRLKLR